MRAVFFVLAIVLFSRPEAARAQNFQIPIECSMGGTCIVQNYADADPAAGVARDFQCGVLSYDGHEGLDFRAPLTLVRRGVNVLAPAAGVVLGVRDGEPERVFVERGLEALDGRDCGNGVGIDHGGGWRSQLCHMRAGSVRVREGERVAAGQVLGQIGMSGRTTFPHAHLSLFRDGERVDPYTGALLAGLRCNARPAAPGAHWSRAAHAGLAHSGTRWFALGFTGTAPARGARLEESPDNAGRNAEALAFWALASGPQVGDVLRVRLYRPDGGLIQQAELTQQRQNPQASLFVGAATPPGGWPAGAYRGVAEVVREGRVVQTRTQTLQLR